LLEEKQRSKRKSRFGPMRQKGFILSGGAERLKKNEVPKRSRETDNKENLQTQNTQKNEKQTIVGMRLL
jgi:hypothetical protein